MTNETYPTASNSNEIMIYYKVLCSALRISFHAKNSAQTPPPPLNDLKNTISRSTTSIHTAAPPTHCLKRHREYRQRTPTPIPSPNYGGTRNDVCLSYAAFSLLLFFTLQDNDKQYNQPKQCDSSYAPMQYPAKSKARSFVQDITSSPPLDLNESNLCPWRTVINSISLHFWRLLIRNNICRYSDNYLMIIDLGLVLVVGRSPSLFSQLHCFQHDLCAWDHIHYWPAGHMPR